uniref:Uncharacterized protein n=1 Tax=Biomphalaria glabrata TaxID=6526 RepID=A0A2C9KG57_BIOGL
MMASSLRRLPTPAEVDRITAVGEALQIMRDFSIPLPTDRNFSLERAKLIIKSFISNRPSNIPGQPNIDTVSSAIKEDASTRKHLRDLYMAAEEYFSKLPKPFQAEQGKI